MIGDQMHVAQFDPRMASAQWWHPYGIPSRLYVEPTHWMPLPAAPGAPQPAEPAPLSFDRLQSVMAKHFGGRELTDDEADSAEAFARAIEAAHGIKPPNAEITGRQKRSF